MFIARGTICLVLTLALLILSPSGFGQQGPPPSNNRAADTLVSIKTVYQNLAALNGQTVKVLGFYTNPQVDKFYTSYLDHLNRRPTPPEVMVYLAGLEPDSLYWNGGMMAVTGTVSFVPKVTPLFGVDTAVVTITAVSLDYFFPGGASPAAGKVIDWDLGQHYESRAGCDSCKFAILMSGGVDAENNNPGFWEDIENLYRYKTSPTGGNYCPENVKVLYYHGDSEDPAVIPHAAVDSCTQANIEKAHKEIAQRIADCERAGKAATVQKMVSNHGEDEIGFNTLGNENVSPEELRNMQQELIDSCCDFLYDEFTECYGGDMVEGLKGLDDKNKTEIHANSAAGGGSCGWGDDDGSPYLLEKITRLLAGDDYESAVDSAKNHYKKWLEDAKAQAESILAVIDSILNELPLDDPDRPALEDARDEWQDLADDLADSINDGSVSWVRLIFKQYCEWKKIVVPPGGQVKITFKGTGGCGNVSVYRQEGDGSKTRIKVWNWNLPGSSGYVAGNEVRVLNGDLTGTGIYWIHNDNGAFSATVESFKTQPLPESPSNQSTFAGFSFGGADGSNGEFTIISGPSLFIPAADAIPFPLPAVPGLLGPCGGIGNFGISFTVYPNAWWNDMELWIKLHQVLNPGDLQIQCPTAEIPFGAVPVDNDDSEVVFPLGAIGGPGTGQLLLVPTSGLCFTIDSWGLRSRVPTYPEFLCGDADGSSSVSISDVVFLINYIFAGGPPPEPLMSGDADCSGSVTISDAVYLINFIFAGGPAPCSACK